MLKQSPGDITWVRIDLQLGPLNLVLRPTPSLLVNHGQAIEREYEPASTLAFGGTVYHLQQVHFPTLSERTVGGWRAVEELHVGSGDDIAQPSEEAVVAVLSTRPSLPRQASRRGG